MALPSPADEEFGRAFADSSGAWLRHSHYTLIGDETALRDGATTISRVFEQQAPGLPAHRVTLEVTDADVDIADWRFELVGVAEFDTTFSRWYEPIPLPADADVRRASFDLSGDETYWYLELGTEVVVDSSTDGTATALYQQFAAGLPYGGFAGDPDYTDPEGDTLALLHDDAWSSRVNFRDLDDGMSTIAVSAVFDVEPVHDDS